MFVRVLAIAAALVPVLVMSVSYLTGRSAGSQKRIQRESRKDRRHFRSLQRLLSDQRERERRRGAD